MLFININDFIYRELKKNCWQSSEYAQKEYEEEKIKKYFFINLSRYLNAKDCLHFSIFINI